MAQAPKKLAIKYFHKGIRHGNVNRTACHFGNASERHIQTEQRIQIRRSSCDSTIHLPLEDPVS